MKVIARRRFTLGHGQVDALDVDDGPALKEAIGPGSLVAHFGLANAVVDVGEVLTGLHSYRNSKMINLIGALTALHPAGWD